MIDDKFSSFYRNVCWWHPAGLVVYGNGEVHSIPLDATEPDQNGVRFWRDEGAPGDGLNVRAESFREPYVGGRVYALYRGAEPMGNRVEFSPEEFVLINSATLATQPGYPVPNDILGLKWRRILKGSEFQPGRFRRKDHIFLFVPLGAQNLDGIPPHAGYLYTLWPPTPRQAVRVLP